MELGEADAVDQLKKVTESRGDDAAAYAANVAAVLRLSAMLSTVGAPSRTARCSSLSSTPRARASSSSVCFSSDSRAAFTNSQPSRITVTMLLSTIMIVPATPWSWRCDPAQAGGALADIGSHIISMARFLVGDIEAVCGRLDTVIAERPKAAGSTGMRPVTVDDQANFLVRFANGASGTISTSTAAPLAAKTVRHPVICMNAAMTGTSPSWPTAGTPT